MSLGSQIRHYRLGLGLKLEQLAERSDVDVGTISALENRGSVRSQFANKIARGLGLSVEQLLDETRDMLPALLAENVSMLGNSPNLREPSSNYPRWPFQHIQPRDYFDLLSDAQRAHVEGFAQGLMASGKARASGDT